MTAYVLKATVRDEICIAHRQETGSQYETLDYIPGRLIWGGLAACTGILPGQKPDDAFMTVFYSGDVIFANLYPAYEETLRAMPVPLSARTRKHQPGFTQDYLGDAPGEHAGGICDWLLPGVPADADDDEFKRFLEWYAEAPPNCRKVQVSRTFVTQHERDNWRGVTREGRLFAREVIARGQVFLGYLRSNTLAGDQALQREFSAIDMTVPASLDLSIGRSPGQITLEILPEEVLPGVVPKPLQSTDLFSTSQFTITCLSETLLVDDYLRPLQEIPAYLLQRHLGSAIKIRPSERFFAGTTIVPGWNGAYQRPCEEELAITKGSSFLFHYQLAPEKTTQDLLQALNALQERGLGVRRPEGFGEIRINDPFHQFFPASVAKGELT